jgi:hypothetical protein
MKVNQAEGVASNGVRGTTVEDEPAKICGNVRQLIPFGVYDAEGNKPRLTDNTELGHMPTPSPITSLIVTDLTVSENTR